MYTIGWIGGILLAWCGLPEVIHSIRNKECNLTWGMLISWVIGEMCLLTYLAHTKDVPVLFNYVMNIIFISVLIFYKVRSRK